MQGTYKVNSMSTAKNIDPSVAVDLGVLASSFMSL